MEQIPPTARADLHVHTRFSGWRHLRVIHPRDSYTEPLHLYRAALARGMDFVAVTDHNTVEGALRLLETPGVDPAKIIVGEELECRFPGTGPWVHLNIYGLSEEDHTHLHAVKGDVREAVRLCRERGLLCVLNHPLQSWRGQRPLRTFLEELAELFTHVEGLNGGVPALQNRAAARLCRVAAEAGRPLVQVGGSDAHTLRRVGRAWTEAPARTAEEFLTAIAAGRCNPGGVGTSTAGLLWDVHCVVGTYYKRLYTGRGEAHGALAYASDAALASIGLAFVAAGVPASIVLGNQVRQKAVAGLALCLLENPASLSFEPYSVPVE